MKRIVLLLALLLSFILILTACGGGDGAATVPATTPASASTNDPQTEATTAPATTAPATTVPATTDPSLPMITGVTFADKTVVFDGTEQTLAVEGDLPAGATVVYTNEKGTDAGSYAASAYISCDGYNPLTLTATLTINPATITGIFLFKRYRRL